MEVEVRMYKTLSTITPETWDQVNNLDHYDSLNSNLSHIGDDGDH